MCGLVGCAGNIMESDKKALMLLMRFDVVRGWDSTGLGVVHKDNGEIKCYKRVGPPEWLFAQEDVFDGRGLYKGPAAKVFIGHNRAATKGKVVDKNAHPFVHDGIIGAHNGTLTSVSTLEDGYKFDVDSEAIFHNLSLYDNKTVIADIWGAYALTWYDDGEEKLFIIRNKERPLYWTRRKDKDVIFWASEKWMLENALSKASVPHEEIFEFEQDCLYSFDLSDVSYNKIREQNWVIEKDVKGYTPPPPKKWTPTHTKSSGGNSNIIPFDRSSNSSNSSSRNHDKVMMKMLEDTDINFRFSAVKKGMSKSEYLAAYPQNIKLDYDIRVYGENHPNWNIWRNHIHSTVYRGRIKRVVENHVKGKYEIYFLIDLRSIRVVGEAPTSSVKKNEDEERTLLDALQNLDSVMPNEEDEPEVYEGFQGRFLTKTEWERATIHGCAGCMCEASPNDADLIFIDHDQFLCGTNQCVDLYKDYIPASAYK